MTKLLLTLAIAFSSVAVHASEIPTHVLDRFFASPEVQTAIAQAQANGLEIGQDVTGALLGGGCGFAGCDYEMLVTLSVSTQGINPQTQVIAAVVGTARFSAKPVRLVSVDVLLAQ